MNTQMIMGIINIQMNTQIKIQRKNQSFILFSMLFEELRSQIKDGKSELAFYILCDIEQDLSEDLFESLLNCLMDLNDEYFNKSANAKFHEKVYEIFRS